MVIDSTILVDAIRGNLKASDFLESVGGRLIISRAGVMEMVRGARSKRDLAVIEKFMDSLRVDVVEITEEISKLAGSIFKNFWHSHGIGAMDSFIAATALILGESIATHNTKHFKPIKQLDLIMPY